MAEYFYPLTTQAGTTRELSRSDWLIADVTDYRLTSQWSPLDHSMKAWTCDPLLASTSYQPFQSGYLYRMAITSHFNFTTTGVAYGITTAGAGLTANRNYIGLYGADGVRLAQTADLASTWTVTGARATVWTAPVSVPAGICFVAFLVRGTTLPAFQSAPYNPLLAFGRSATTYRAGVVGTSMTALPTTLPAATGDDDLIWAGLY